MRFRRQQTFVPARMAATRACIFRFCAAALWLAASPVIAQDVPAEKFVPGGSQSPGATLELRPEVNVIGAEVKLKSVCRWSNADNAAFEPVAELVLLRLKQSAPYRTLSIDELKQTLTDAGVNLAMIRFAGATLCTVARTDVKFDERSALEHWIAAREAPATRPTLVETPATRPATTQSAAAATTSADEPKVHKSLRDHLVAEISERLNLPAEQFQFYFNPADERFLKLSEPLFKFNVKVPRNRNIGDVTWEVTLVSGEATQKSQITATVKIWQNQLVVARPMSYRQAIGETDLMERRALVDRLPEDPLVTREQVVGQMASRDLKPGTLMTGRLVEPTLLIKSGQLVTILMNQGSIQAKTVVRALEQGTMGQTIRVKNEATGNTLDVIVTGPQSATLPSAPRDVVQLDR